MSGYALITGASSGIGLAIAEALARQGHNLILVARRREALDSIASELTQRFGIKVLFRICDLSEPLQLSGLLHELEHGPWSIDLLVNNAGLGCAGAFLQQDWGREQRQLEVNVLALTRLCHALGQHMAQRGGGQILNLASLAAFQPGPWMSSYYASKAYVLHFSEGLREELRPLGVHVCTLCPGPTRSAFFRDAQMDISRLENSPLLMKAEEVALIALKGLAKNRAIIIPGWRNRLLTFLPRFTPRWLVRWLSGRLTRTYGGL
ncbi:SDR family oxidoreductase [Pseudomonas sp. NCCP-436]|uniref:SDR family NAD(P)-dependent oxidoreductase n=1 Tax=Pseudomonas sp. NCCP-436 TaxID=2842481 RepID=UPI001C7EEF6E|nr:SDR family oxidoreductase [Pseudomonas sp. NCCP-436]GIZ12752.1 short-chain dehydrogenase [Pseudomonas sp. NCCP-436]